MDEKGKPLRPPLRSPDSAARFAKLETAAAEMRGNHHPRKKKAHTTGRPAFVSAILRRVAIQHGTTPESIVEIQRNQVSLQKNITAARRQVIRELASDPRRFSKPMIGRWLNINHTSVIYHLQGWTAPVPAPYDPDAPDESGIWNV